MKVADFFNSSQLYDDEIELRKESLNEIFAIDSLKGDKFKSKENKNIASLNSIINGWLNTKLENGELVIYDNDITEQSINYKIGRAYVQKEAYKDAIPFLKNSK